MNHLTLYAYEDENGELFVYRCPEESCGSTGEADSHCEEHEPPLADFLGRGPKRKPVRVPGVGEKPRYTLEQVRAALTSDEAVEALALHQHQIANTRQYCPQNLDDLSEMQRACKRGEARISLGRALDAALDHFTQLPAGVGADIESAGGRQARKFCAEQASADSGGKPLRWVEEQLAHFEANAAKGNLTEYGEAQLHMLREFRTRLVSADSDGNQRARELRHSVLTTVRDALHWTDPSETDEHAFAVLVEGLDLLAADPVASEEREENWMTSVLNAGWWLMPPREEIDSDGNQQPQGGDDENASSDSAREVLAEGGSVQCDGVALAQLLSAIKVWRNATESRLKLLNGREPIDTMIPADRALIEAAERVEALTQQPESRAEELLRDEVASALEYIADQAEKKPGSVIHSDLAFYVHDWDFADLIAPARKLAAELDRSPTQQSSGGQEGEVEA